MFMLPLIRSSTKDSRTNLFSPSIIPSYVEAEAVEFSRFRFHRKSTASTSLVLSKFPTLITDSQVLLNEIPTVVDRDVAAAPQTPQLGGGPRPTLGAQVSLKLLFGYVTIFSLADLFTTDLNCRKKLACDIISECNVILSRRI